MECKTCRYWDLPGTATPNGYCRRYPITRLKGPTAWCGEYEVKEENRKERDEEFCRKYGRFPCHFEPVLPSSPRILGPEKMVEILKIVDHALDLEGYKEDAWLRSDLRDVISEIVWPR